MWFGSKSSHRQTHFNSPPALDNVQPGHSDVSSVSQSTVGPPPNTSDVPLDEAHTHPSLYATTPSLTEKEAATPRTTNQDAASYQRDSVQRVLPPESMFFTPQDVVIAQVLGKSVWPATDPRATPPPSNAVQQSVSDSLPPSSRARPVALPLYDPFSGTKLGEHTPASPSTTTPGDLSSFAPIPTVDDRKQWSSLERILELQAEVAVMHADMEGAGGRGPGNHAGIASVGVAEGGHAAPRKRSRRGQTLPVGDEEPEEPEGGPSTGAAVSEISTDHSDGEDEDEEDDDDIHGYAKKRRDEEFARLAEQFAQRKAAIGGIMNKLDDLSMALKAFHALPPPLFDLATSSSRADTLSSAPSATPPSHPLHVYPTSSPLSSISPSQAVSSIAHPAAPLSPPVPPISTLAPLISPSAPLGRIVAPVLPRTAVAIIIPGASPMESPADMEPGQSIFQGMSRASG